MDKYFDPKMVTLTIYRANKSTRKNDLLVHIFKIPITTQQIF